MMELIQHLTSNLDVDESQAKGGAGLIFQLAQKQLGDSEFAQVASAIPGIGDLIGQAPEPSGGAGLAGAIGGLAGAFGGGGSKVAGLAALAGGFGQLGLNPAMVSQFAPIILSFVQNKGGDGVKDILAQVLK